ncbi:class I SAM-dependent methyltransferase [Variovorax guangxiensis]|uniref:class I SAM-dependent methyltransferase n=1 Tax=Variovorax guangxiensis TaxID=1775474 RepID=UPI0038F69A6E
MTMDTTTPQSGNDQAAFWNGRAGRAWVDEQQVLDAVLQPFEDLLVEALVATSAQRVLDVGCGTGSTTLAIARRLGTNGRCVGVDISEPMIAVARARAESEGAPASFVCADAQRHAFEPASFDMIVSRFGVMFFDDPVLAFANLRRAASKDARLHAIVWRGAAENPFMTTAERAAAPLLTLPPRQPGAPGQFAFADRGRVASILESSGWTGIDIQPIDVTCTLPEKELVGYFTRLGPVGSVLQDADERTRARVISTVRAAFDPFVQASEVRFSAACWSVSAAAA